MTPVPLAVIPAAGRARRWRPLSHYIPKEMLPVGSRPLIHHLLHTLHEVGIREVIAVLHEDKPLLADYLRERMAGIPRVHVMYQRERTGVIPAVSRALQDRTPRYPVLVAYPDNFFPAGPTGFPDFLNAARQHGATLLAFVPLTETVQQTAGASAPWDIKQGKDHLLYPQSVGEKGREWRPHSAWRAVGLWALHPKDLPLLHSLAGLAVHAGREVDDVDFFRELLRRKRLLGYRFQAPVVDTGNPKGYIQAWKHFLERHP